MVKWRFRVLGTVEVTQDGEQVPLRSPGMVNLVAALATSPNRVIPASRLIELIWDDQLPDHPKAALQSAISRFRQLTSLGIIETRPPGGYRLHADADTLDLLRFEELRALAHQAQTDGALESAVKALDEAVALCSPPFLADVESQVLRDEVLPDLAERYIDAVEKLAGLYLQLGSPHAVIRDLSKVARSFKHREYTTGLLMVALSRVGRQAEAGDAYNRLRGALRDDLGMDPCRELQDLQLRLLRGKYLDWPPKACDV